MSGVIGVTVEADFGAGWVDITPHTDSGAAPIVISRGFGGDGGPTNGCARTGTATFTLSNMAHGTLSRPQGYWSPGHAAGRAGWGYKTPIRIIRTTDSVDATRFVGWVSEIQPQAGRYREQRVSVTATDWMEEAAATPAAGVTLTADVGAGALVSALVALVPRAPTDTDLADGVSVFPYALDDLGDGARVLEGLARVAQSEGGQLYVSADGTLVLADRHARLSSASDADLDDDGMRELDAVHGPARLTTGVRVTVHPRQVDPVGSTTVLASLDLSSPISVAPGQTLVVEATYQDARGETCAGTDMIAPVPGTDYIVNSRPDGTGYQIYVGVTVSATYDATRVVWTIENITDDIPVAMPDGGGPLGGLGETEIYVLRLQARGRAVSAPQSLTAEARASSGTLAAYGGRPLSVDLPYEADPNVAAAWAAWWLMCDGSPRTVPQRVTFTPAGDATLCAAALLDLNARVSITETMTAPPGDAGTFEESAFDVASFATDPARTLYVITGITETYEHAGGWLTVAWDLAPVYTRADWIVFDDATTGVFDGSGVMGYL